jgi:hypothetical protein
VLAVRYGENVPLLWGWLAGEIPSKKYDRLYVESIGLGIQDSVRQHAARLCSLQREFVAIEQELFDTPLAEAEGILNSATDLKMFCPCGNS